MYRHSEIPKSALIFRELVERQLTKKTKGIVAQRLQIELLREKVPSVNISPTSFTTNLLPQSEINSARNVKPPYMKVILIDKRPSTIHCKLEALKSMSRNYKFPLRAGSFYFKGGQQRRSRDIEMHMSKAELNINKIIRKSSSTNDSRVGGMHNINSGSVPNSQRINNLHKSLKIEVANLSSRKDTGTNAIKEPRGCIYRYDMSYRMKKPSAMRDEQN